MMEIKMFQKLSRKPAGLFDIAKIGAQIAKIGIEIMKQGFNLKYFDISANELKTAFKDKVGCSISLWDNIYRYTTLEAMQKIIEVDWTDEKKYKKDVFDCDNFAYLFASRMAGFFEINAVGVTLGILRHPKTDAFLGWHAWCIFVARVGNQIEFFNLETERNDFVKIEKGKPIIIKNWKYCPTWAIFY